MGDIRRGYWRACWCHIDSCSVECLALQACRDEECGGSGVIEALRVYALAAVTFTICLHCCIGALVILNPCHLDCLNLEARPCLLYLSKDEGINGGLTIV